MTTFRTSPCAKLGKYGIECPWAPSPGRKALWVLIRTNGWRIRIGNSVCRRRKRGRRGERRDWYLWRDKMFLNHRNVITSTWFQYRDNRRRRRPLGRQSAGCRTRAGRMRRIWTRRACCCACAGVWPFGHRIPGCRGRCTPRPAYSTGPSAVWENKMDLKKKPVDERMDREVCTSEEMRSMQGTLST